MTQPDSLEPGDLDALSVSDDDGNTIACIAMLATFYIDDTNTARRRAAIARFVDRYIALVGTQLRWALDSNGKLRNLTRRPLASIIADMQALSEDTSFSLQLSGAADFDHASPYELECLAAHRHRRERLGYVSASFPLGFLEAQTDGFFFGWVRGACEDLQPLHGYAGLAVVRSLDLGARRASERAIYPFAARFPGLEIDDPVDHQFYLKDGIKGVNWLTIVGDRLLARIGGRSAVRARLSEAITVHDTSCGLIVQAGPFPQIGDREAGFVPQRYREVYKVLKALQADYPCAFIATPEPIDPMDFKDRWMARFD